MFPPSVRTAEPQGRDEKEAGGSCGERIRQTADERHEVMLRLG